MLFPPPFTLPISYFTYCFKHPIVFLALHFLLHISCLSLPAPHMLLSHFRAYTSCFKHPMITFPGLHFLLQTPYDHISWPTLPASNILSSHFLAYTSCFTFPVFCFLLHISWPTLPASHFLSFASCFVHAMLDRKLDNRKCEEENIEKEVRNRNFCLSGFSFLESLESEWRKVMGISAVGTLKRSTTTKSSCRATRSSRTSWEYVEILCG